MKGLPSVGEQFAMAAQTAARGSPQCELWLSHVPADVHRRGARLTVGEASWAEEASTEGSSPTECVFSLHLATVCRAE